MDLIFVWKELRPLGGNIHHVASEFVSFVTQFFDWSCDSKLSMHHAFQRHPNANQFYFLENLFLLIIKWSWFLTNKMLEYMRPFRFEE